MMYIIIRQPYAYLEEVLRRAFEGRDDVKVIVDRRYGDRRMDQHPIATERRRAERRRPTEEVLYVVSGEVRRP
jgi:hypothetical protein